MTETPRRRARPLIAACCLIVAGLALRLAPPGLPIFAIRHGGNIAWGAMVFCLVATLLYRGGRPMVWIAVACLVAVGSELFRLIHAPALDHFRTTLAGALLIGRVFSHWNVVDYALGIFAAGGVLRARGRLQTRGTGSS